MNLELILIKLKLFSLTLKNFMIEQIDKKKINIHTFSLILIILFFYMSLLHIVFSVSKNIVLISLVNIILIVITFSGNSRENIVIKEIIYTNVLKRFLIFPTKLSTFIFFEFLKINVLKVIIVQLYLLTYTIMLMFYKSEVLFTIKIFFLLQIALISALLLNLISFSYKLSRQYKSPIPGGKVLNLLVHFIVGISIPLAYFTIIKSQKIALTDFINYLKPVSIKLVNSLIYLLDSNIVFFVFLCTITVIFLIISEFILTKIEQVILRLQFNRNFLTVKMKSFESKFKYLNLDSKKDLLRMIRNVDLFKVFIFHNINTLALILGLTISFQELFPEHKSWNPYLLISISFYIFKKINIDMTALTSLNNEGKMIIHYLKSGYNIKKIIQGKFKLSLYTCLIVGFLATSLICLISQVSITYFIYYVLIQGIVMFTLCYIDIYGRACNVEYLSNDRIGSNFSLKSLITSTGVEIIFLNIIIWSLYQQNQLFETVSINRETLSLILTIGVSFVFLSIISWVFSKVGNFYGEYKNSI